MSAYKLLLVTSISLFLLACDDTAELIEDIESVQTELSSNEEILAVTAPLEEIRMFETYYSQVQFEHISNLSSSLTGRVEHIHVSEGMHVSAGEPLVRLHIPGMDERLNQFNANIDRASAQVEFLRRERVRKEQLFQQAFIGVSELERAREQLSVAQSNLAVAIADRDAFERQSDERMLLAPYSGTVEELFGELGEQLLANQSIVLISGGALEVRVRVSPRVIQATDIGDIVKVKLLDMGIELTGQITSLGTGITTENGSAFARLQIDSTDRNIAGQSVAIELPSFRALGYKIPLEMLRTDYADGTAQILVRNGERRELERVQIVSVDNDDAYVTSSDNREIKVIYPSRREQ